MRLASRTYTPLQARVFRCDNRTKGQSETPTLKALDYLLAGNGGPGTAVLISDKPDEGMESGT